MTRSGRVPKTRDLAGRYGPARRLHEVRTLLHGGDGLTVYDIMERFSVSLRTAIRYLRALEDAGEPLVEEVVGRRKVWRIAPGGRRETITLTLAQMTSLFLSRRVFDFLSGTGFKEDLDDVFETLEKTLRRRDVARAQNLHLKIYDVNEAPYLYGSRAAFVDDIVTALLKEERLRVAHEGIPGGAEVLFDPYTLVVYKKGLYLAGYSHHHRGIRKLGLDGFTRVEWVRGDRFEYPPGYDPGRLFEGSFGLITGPRVQVRIFFTNKVAKFVRRRLWHASQKIRNVSGGIELRMDVAGTTELASWILSWGDQAKVLEPAALREEVHGELSRAAASYAAER